MSLVLSPAETAFLQMLENYALLDFKNRLNLKEELVGRDGAQSGGELEPHVYVQRYSGGPDTKEKSHEISHCPGSISCFL